MSDSRERKQKRLAALAGRPRCRALVRHRDTYRYTGRSKSGFEMHYTKSQCLNAALPNKTHCRARDKEYTLDYDYATDTFAALEKPSTGHV